MNEYRRHILDWLDKDDWSDWYAVTLTMRQSLPNVDGEDVFLTQQSASRNLRHFLNRTNKRWYGNASVRHNIRCEVIPTFEKGSDGRNLHYHLFIKRPSHVPEWKFRLRLQGDWFRTEWGNLLVPVKGNCDTGWLEYITKDTQGNNSDPAWNFENVDYSNIWFVG